MFGMSGFSAAALSRADRRCRCLELPLVASLLTCPH
jgi:hypothetical protein